LQNREIKEDKENGKNKNANNKMYHTIKKRKI